MSQIPNNYDQFNRRLSSYNILIALRCLLFLGCLIVVGVLFSLDVVLFFDQSCESAPAFYITTVLIVPFFISTCISLTAIFRICEDRRKFIQDFRTLIDNLHHYEKE